MAVGRRASMEGGLGSAAMRRGVKYWRAFGVAAAGDGYRRHRQLPTRARSNSYAKALVPFQAQRWQDAQQLLNEALAADPDDAVAVYYRGLTEARLGNTANADPRYRARAGARTRISSRRCSISASSTSTAASTPRHSSGCERAYQQPDSRFSAAFYLGVTKLRLGDHAGALPLPSRSRRRIRRCARPPSTTRPSRCCAAARRVKARRCCSRCRPGRPKRRPRRSPSSS